MQPLAEPVTKLIDAFGQLPGIGPKTASRLTYFLLRADTSVSLNLARALEELKANTLFCSTCHNIVAEEESDSKLLQELGIQDAPPEPAAAEEGVAAEAAATPAT